jgi:hypothetical protein
MECGRGLRVSSRRAADHVPATCSAVSALDEPLPGTAAVVHRWLCVEHPGAWGRDVVDDAPLGAEVTAELDRRCKAAGMRLMLIRQSGRRGDSPYRQVFIANSAPGDSWCEQLRVANAAELLEVPFEQRGAGEPVTDPVVLVCAHGKRDQCCARLGRPIAAGLGMDYRGLVWECSHTGGHRFAPSLIMLPSGYSYGRLDVSGARKAIEMLSEGRVSGIGLRGRSCYSAAGQAAEIAVRDLVDAGTDDLSVEGGGSEFIVRHSDGRQWGVEVASGELPPREVSCGAKPKPVETVTVRRLWRINHED